MEKDSLLEIEELAKAEGFEEEVKLYGIAKEILKCNDLECQLVSNMEANPDHPVLCFDGEKIWILPAKSDPTGSVMEITKER